MLVYTGDPFDPYWNSSCILGCTDSMHLIMIHSLMLMMDLVYQLFMAVQIKLL